MKRLTLVVVLLSVCLIIGLSAQQPSFRAGVDIVSLNVTVTDAATHYITDLVHNANLKVTRLAHGVPVGGELDYLDEGTLAAAIKQRTAF